MQTKRNVTPAGTEKKRVNPRLILKRSLVSDRLGAQGFDETAKDRSAELPLGANVFKPQAEQELGASEPGKNVPFEQN